jgi:peptidoglycan lytic transglycosylase G
MPTAAPTVNVTIPEGTSIREAAPRVKAAGLRGSYVQAAARRPPAALRAPKSVHTLEGLLFPARYQVRRHASTAALVAKQQAAFGQNLARIPMADARARHLTPYDVVIIASLVERETGTASDRPKIAAVIYNRLRLHMPLGIDASLRYGLRDWHHRITQSDLASPTPYNLSKRLGLPPTPIGNPGLASLRAAAHPARVSYLYFVARPGTCGSVFTSSYSAFLRASAKYQAAQRSGQKITTCAGG